MEAILIQANGGGGRLDEKLLRPEDESIWRHAGTSDYLDCVTGDCMSFVKMTWKRKHSDEVRYTHYAYFVGDVRTESRLQFRLRTGWHHLLGDVPATGLIAFQSHGELPSGFSLAAVFEDLRASLLQPGKSTQLAHVSH